MITPDHPDPNVARRGLSRAHRLHTSRRKMKTSIKRTACAAALATVLGVVAGAPIGASAQSAEHTVAFMLWGLEEGPTTKQVGSNTWKAYGHDGDDERIFEIAQLTDCLFSVSKQVRRAGTSDELRFDYVLDFGAVRAYSAWPANGRDQRIIVKIEGNSWYSKTVLNKTTGRVLQSNSGGNVDVYVADGGSAERLMSTFAHFRSAFCGGANTSPSANPPGSRLAPSTALMHARRIGP